MKDGEADIHSTLLPHQSKRQIRAREPCLMTYGLVFLQQTLLLIGTQFPKKRNMWHNVYPLAC